MYYGQVGIKSDIERGYCPANHAIKATVVWEPENHCRIFVVGKSYARMIKSQKHYFVETLKNNKTNSGHKHMPHMYFSHFQKHLYDESAISLRFEVLTKPIYKCNEDRPYCATKYQYIFIQYREGFNFVSGKPSPEFDRVHPTIPEGQPSFTPYTNKLQVSVMDT